MSKAELRALQLFVSYAPEDQELKDELLKHLSVLQRVGVIAAWSADRIRAGVEWRQEVEAALAQSDIVLLLVSRHFLASGYIQNIELRMVFERRAQSRAHVIPVLLRSCLWSEHSWLGTLKQVPASGKAIAAYEGDARDQAMAEVVSEVARIARESQPVLPATVKAKANDARIAEAKHVTGALAKAIGAYVYREDHKGRSPGLLPMSAPLTPARVPSGGAVMPDEKLWRWPWTGIYFSITGPSHFSYEYLTSPDRRSAVVRAHGDLHGDGVITIVERTVTLMPNGDVVISPDVSLVVDPPPSSSAASR